MTVEKPADYYGQERQEMLRYIPPASTRILDFGCGSGKFAGQLKSRNNAEVWGVEINHDAASIASNILDQVRTGNIYDVLPGLPRNYFDAIVFNDVLEHLEDPCSVLDKCRNLLTKDGCLVCSIPNVRYIANLYNLIIKKDWKYEDYGILDRTHLRFFTRKSIIEMFNGLDYVIECIEGINPIRHKLFPLINMLSLGMLSDTKFLQFAVVAKPKKK